MTRDRDPTHLIAAERPSAFLDDGPTSKLIRQVPGAVAEFDKAMTVAKLRGARERRRREQGKCEAESFTPKRTPKWCSRRSVCAAHRPSTASAGHSARSAASWTRWVMFRAAGPLLRVHGAGDG